MCVCVAVFLARLHKHLICFMHKHAFSGHSLSQSHTHTPPLPPSNHGYMNTSPSVIVTQCFITRLRQHCASFLNVHSQQISVDWIYNFFLIRELGSVTADTKYFNSKCYVPVRAHKLRCLLDIHSTALC